MERQNLGGGEEDEGREKQNGRHWDGCKDVASWKKKKIFHPKTQADISVIDVNVGDYNMAINDQLKYVLI